MKSDDPETPLTFGLVTCILVGVIYALLLNGFTLQMLWGWFVVPKFGLTLDLKTACGLCILLSFVFTRSTKKREKLTWERLGFAIAMVTLNAATCLSFGKLLTLLLS